MSKKQKMIHIYVFEGDAIGTIEYTVIRDGLNNTVKFPNKGDMVTIKETLYVVIAIHYDYDQSFIAYHLSLPETEP